jgi:hypothetical protein
LWEPYGGGQNVELQYIKAYGTYNNHRALKG